MSAFPDYHAKPGHTPITDALWRILAMPARVKLDDLDNYTKADLFAARMYNSANAGNGFARREILERIEGKVKQVIAGDPDNPLKIDLVTALQNAIELHDKMIDVTPRPLEADRLLASEVAKPGSFLD